MITKMIPQPGSEVYTQDPTKVRGRSGCVIKSPVGMVVTEQHPEDYVWVQWSDGIQRQEHLGHLLLTGVLYLDVVPLSTEHFYGEERLG